MDLLAEGGWTCGRGAAPVRIIPGTTKPLEVYDGDRLIVPGELPIRPLERENLLRDRRKNRMSSIPIQNGQMNRNWYVKKSRSYSGWKRIDWSCFDWEENVQD
ncbi:hypothetical protein RvY_06806 [Ramazzottius varieornatus]|uniref:Uncharacterized protein n=1 Tax=Ramazzottius varieornatus TaxID=947166 RepID=A0A1D1V075_RAMVA|nr:hypothetical protein RvY_06806 [Ramazzottius varieornatus]